MNGRFLDEHIGPEVATERRFRLVEIADVVDMRINANVYAYVLLAMALGLLGLAVTNVTNLATARSLERAQEMGVRKALGARRSRLAAQFLVETQLLSFGALIVGLAVGQMLLPTFSTLIELDLQIAWTDPTLWSAVVGLGVCMGLLAGAYPALVLSAFSPRRRSGATSGVDRAARTCAGFWWADSLPLPFCSWPARLVCSARSSTWRTG